MDEASAQKVFEDGPRVLLGGVQCGIQSDLWIEGTLIRVIDAGETLDLAPASLGIEALAIALLARIERESRGAAGIYPEFVPFLACDQEIGGLPA